MEVMRILKIEFYINCITLFARKNSFIFIKVIYKMSCD